MSLQSRSAVILIPNDSARTGRSRPMLLSRVMGAAALRWLTDALTQRGVHRYFLVCQDRYLNEAKLCFPDGCQLTACVDREASDPLHVFLSSAKQSEGSVLVITGACVCLPPAEGVAGKSHAACACEVDQNELMSALDEEDFSFSRFLLSRGAACTEEDGLYPISSQEELETLASKMKLARLQSLAQQGVEIWDPERCYVDPGVSVGRGAVLMPGSILRGRTVVGQDCVIGPDALLENANVGNGCRINASQLWDSTLGSDCAVGPFACLRQGSSLGSRVRVGTGTELNAVTLGEGTHVGAACCLRELECGRSCTIGPGCITAASMPETVGRIVLDDDAVIGGGATFAGPVSVGRCAAVAAGATIAESVPSQALAIARGRQTTRKDWALHK